MHSTRKMINRLRYLHIVGSNNFAAALGLSTAEYERIIRDAQKLLNDQPDVAALADRMEKSSVELQIVKEHFETTAALTSRLQESIRTARKSSKKGISK